MKTIKLVFVAIAIILFIDFAGMICWAMSGQRPIDGMYIGAISTNVIRHFVDSRSRSVHSLTLNFQEQSRRTM